MGYRNGEDRLLLRFPMVVAHVITPASPLAAWLQGPSALHADADSEIVVLVSPPAPQRPAGITGLGTA